MVATVHIEQITGSPGSETYTYKDTTSGTRYYTADIPDKDSTAYPIPIPTNNNGISGSYWATHCINVVSAPSTYIKNLRYYQTWNTSPKDDWSLGNGGDLVIGISSSTISDARTFTQGFPSSQYDQATGTIGVCGDFISGNHAYYAACASPLSGGATTITDFDSVNNAYMVQSGQVVGATTGRSYCIVTQVLVGSGATQGEKVDKTATFVYSEV